jgi:hypothetical protein
MDYILKRPNISLYTNSKKLKLLIHFYTADRMLYNKMERHYAD